MDFEMFRQRALVRGCDTCLHRNECDEPIEPCPPVSGKNGKFDRKMISPLNPNLWNWIESVGGTTDLDVAWPAVPVPDLPTLVPGFKMPLNGPGPVDTPWAGITLSKVLTTEGRLRYQNAPELLREYNLAPNTRLLLVMVEKDLPLENFWKHATPSLYERMAPFGFSAAIAPNFSIFMQRSPLEHRINYKRSLIVASALARVGIPTIPHVYAAGPRAVTRWVEYLRKNSSITTIAREVQTAKTDHLFNQSVLVTRAIADRVHRPLHVVFVGPLARRRVARLAEEFSSFSVVSSHLSMLASHYRHLVPHGDWLKARHDPTIVPTRAFEWNVRLATEALRSVLEPVPKKSMPIGKTPLAQGVAL